MKSFDKEFFRFIFFGFVNTAAGYLFYIVLLLFLPYPVSYTLSYAIGIALSYFLNSRFVFNMKMRFEIAIRYPLVYVIQYVLGVGLLYVLIELLQIAKFIAPVLILFLTIPVSYFASRLIIKGHLPPQN
jgi:putative flippase GtrA